MGDSLQSMEPTAAIIERVASHYGLTPALVFAGMLEYLRRSHHMSAVADGAAGAARHTFVDEVRSRANAAGIVDTPRSVLEAIDVVVAWDAQAAHANARLPGAPPPHVARHGHEARLLDAVRMVIREAMNQTDHDALKAQMGLEKWVRERRADEGDTHRDGTS